MGKGLTTLGWKRRRGVVTGLVGINFRITDDAFSERGTKLRNYRRQQNRTSLRQVRPLITLVLDR